MSDFIPQGNVKFNLWQGNLAAILEPNVVLWNIKTEDYLPLNAARIVWNNAFAKASSRKNRNSGDVQARVDARKKYTKVLRSFIAQWLSNNSKVPNSNRQRMGITVKSGTRTPASIPVSCPSVLLFFLRECSIRSSFMIVPLRAQKPNLREYRAARSG